MWGLGLILRGILGGNMVNDLLRAILELAFFPNKLITCGFGGTDRVILTLKITLTLSDGS